jgi:hypothetical protein
MTPKKAVLAAGAVVNVMVLPDTVYEVIGSWMTPPREMIKALADPGVTAVEELVRLKVVVDPLKPDDISSIFLYEPTRGGLPI